MSVAKKKICYACQDISVSKIIKTDSSTPKPKWLSKTDYMDLFIKKIPLKMYKQKNTSMKMLLDIGKPNVYVLYWGAEPNSNIKIRDAKDAYGKFSNYGVGKTDSQGKIMCYFDCPSPYSEMDNKNHRETFYRHLHFTYSKNGNNWLDAIYTKLIVCILNYNQTMKSHQDGKIVLINALPCSYYAMSHIPNSYNLDAKTIKKMSLEELNKWMTQVVETNYPKINKMLKSKKINLYELPIVVYCAHDKCNAGHKCAMEFLKKGFVNISDFKGGMKEYLKH